MCSLCYSLASHKIPWGQPISLEVCGNSPTLSKMWIHCYCPHHRALPLLTCSRLLRLSGGVLCLFLPLVQHWQSPSFSLKACLLNRALWLLLLHISSSVASTFLLCLYQASSSFPSMPSFPISLPCTYLLCPSVYSCLIFWSLVLNSTLVMFSQEVWNSEVLNSIPLWIQTKSESLARKLHICHPSSRWCLLNTLLSLLFYRTSETIWSPSI